MAVFLIFALSILVLLLYKYSTRNFNYWKDKGVPFVKPIPFFGSFFNVFAQRTPIGIHLGKCYNQFHTSYFGMYVLNRPHLVIRSRELISRILVQDFSKFYNRTLVSDEKLDPVSSKMLFLSRNPEWKFLRTKITPMFSSGKTKSLIPLINAVGEEMKTYLGKKQNQESSNAKDVCSKFTINVVATCALGINANCFTQKNCEFERVAKRMFGDDGYWRVIVRQLCYFAAPRLVKIFRMPFLDHSVTDFLREIIMSSMNERERTKQTRNDVIDIMVRIRNNPSPQDILKFDNDVVVASAGQFYTAGYETSSSTMSFTLYELCLQPKIQTKLRLEIKNVIAQHGGVSHEALEDMKYLDMVVSETLRKYPILPFLDRTCMEAYKIPDSDLVIEKGTSIYIPVFGLHYDPKYFPDPERYDPDRFSEERKSGIPRFAYMPFGEGPRKCIGMRLGLQTTKLGLIHILSEFEVEPHPLTPNPLIFDARSFLLISNVGLPLNFRNISS